MNAAAALDLRTQSCAGGRYTAYGMSIESDLALPELELSGEDRPADLRIVMTAPSALWESLRETAFRFAPGRQFLAWPRVGAFTITDADTITIDPYPGVDEQLLRMPLLGPVLASLLHERGRLVLHASAVRVGDGCAILLGDKGAGKSTTAAALVAAGHPLMTDDVAALDVSGDGVVLEPGFPQMKLDLALPPAAGVETAYTLPPPAENFPKALRRLTAGFCETAVAPRCIYVLGRGQTAGSEAMSGPQALAAVMRFSYTTRFAGRLSDPAAAAAHFRQCAAVADHVTVRRLTAPVGVERLGEVVKLIERDVASATAGR